MTPAKERDRRLGRRKFLQGGSLALTAGLAGCTGFNKDHPPSYTPTPGGEDTPAIYEIPDGPSATFKGTKDDGFTFQYEDLPKLVDTLHRSTNAGHPDTNITNIEVMDGEIEATIKNIAIHRELKAQLWLNRGDDVELHGEKTLQPNSDDSTNPDYETVTLTFTGTPEPETHVATFAKIALVDEAIPTDGPDIPGRLLKAKRAYQIPYNTPSGRKIKTFGGNTVNREHYRGTVNRDIIRNDTHAIDNDDGSKTLFAIMDIKGETDTYWDREAYGVATTIPASDWANQNETRKNWPSYYGDITNNTKNWEHFQTLAQELRNAHKKLGNWDTPQSRYEAIAQFVAALPYELRGQNGQEYTIQHPTRSLYTGKGNCTEKTLIFATLLKTDVFNFSGDDAAYMLCTLYGSPHIVPGININKFDNPNDAWERYPFRDFAQEYGAPADPEFVPIEVTSPGPIGFLGDSYAHVRADANIEGDYTQF